MSETNPETTPEPTPAPVKVATDKPTRYAAYDKRFEKFVGGVHNTKTDAGKAGKAKGVKTADLEIREV